MLSNYLLKFSNEYQQIYNGGHFDNDWYDYVEYGTSNAGTLLLQHIGFTRESVTFIRHKVSPPLAIAGDQRFRSCRSSTDRPPQYGTESAGRVGRLTQEAIKPQADRV